MLDPGIQAVLDAMNGAPGPPAHEVPVAQGRAAYASETARLCGPAEPVAQIRDVGVGEIPAGAEFQPERRAARRSIGRSRSRVGDTVLDPWP